MTNRINLENIVMQGTVWGSIKCTAQQDKLGKAAYKNKEPIYMYKNSVEVPPIGYVDDILTVARCGNKSVINNTVANAFTDSRKLKYGAHKCKKLHIGKESNNCPKLKVHEELIQTSQSEKYLGETISNSGKHRENIQERRWMCL